MTLTQKPVRNFRRRENRLIDQVIELFKYCFFFLLWIFGDQSMYIPCFQDVEYQTPIDQDWSPIVVPNLF